MRPSRLPRHRPPAGQPKRSAHRDHPRTVVWLGFFGGAKQLYTTHLRPWFKAKEAEIDAKIAEAKGLAAEKLNEAKALAAEKVAAGAKQD